MRLYHLSDESDELKSLSHEPTDKYAVILAYNLLDRAKIIVIKYKSLL